MRSVSFLIAFAGTLSAQLVEIYPRGVVNSASSLPSGLPAGAIARGSVFSIYGNNIGPTTPVTVSAFPIGATLGGVSITFSQGNTTVNILPLFVSATQVNALMPSNAPLGTGSMRLTYNNARSNPSRVQVAAAAFGIYTFTGTGLGPGAILNFVAADNQPYNSPAVPAMPGQAVTLYGTGLGAISSSDANVPPVQNLPTQTEVFVGGQSASIFYSGRSSCCAGIDQIVFTVPPNAPTGCWVPVLVRTGGSTSSNGATMAISADGSPCSDPANPLTPLLVRGGKGGVIRLVRSSTREDIGTVRPLEVSDDLLTFDFSQIKTTPFVYSPAASLPPPGTCAVVAGAGDFLAGGASPSIPVIARSLSGGTVFTLNTPQGARTLTSSAGALGAVIGSFAPYLSSLPNQLVLSPATYTVTTVGGADVPSFSAQITVPGPITWSGRDTLDVVNRATPLTLSWSGVPSGKFVRIYGGNVDLPTNSSATFSCLAPPGASSFTIPAAVLQALPPSRSNPLLSKGAIYLDTALPQNGTVITPSGFDTAIAVGGQLLGKTVVFQ